MLVLASLQSTQFKDCNPQNQICVCWQVVTNLLVSVSMLQGCTAVVNALTGVDVCTPPALHAMHVCTPPALHAMHVQ